MNLPPVSIAAVVLLVLYVLGGSSWLGALAVGGLAVLMAAAVVLGFRWAAGRLCPIIRREPDAAETPAGAAHEA